MRRVVPGKTAPRGDGEAGILRAWLLAASFLPRQHLLWGFFSLFLTAPYAAVSKQWRLHTDWEPSPALPPSWLPLPGEAPAPTGLAALPGRAYTTGTVTPGREGCHVAPAPGEPASAG